MPSLWIGNFSFEDQLLGRRDQSSIIQRFEAELTPCLAAAASEDDLILCPKIVDEGFRTKLINLGFAAPNFISLKQLKMNRGKITELSPWGWTDQIRDLAQELEIQVQSPPHEAVLATNSRSCSLMLSRKLSCQLPGEMEVHSMSELKRALSQSTFADGFVMKSEFGQSGRGQIMSRGNDLSENENRWAKKRFENGRTLYLEPKLNPVNEFGIQWEIPQQGAPALFGITSLNSGRNGQFTSSTVNIQLDLFPELEFIIEKQQEACHEIQKTGYFGPMGVDAMVYVDADEARKIRPLQDINARWTMGRLAICWASICFPGKKNVTWAHGNSDLATNAIKTSPETIGGESVKHQTWCYT